MSEYQKRRDEMLSYYPEVASAGDLATALSRAFAEEGSSLIAYSPVPPEKPTWPIFSDHPDAPGTTVPEIARVKTRDVGGDPKDEEGSRGVGGSAYRGAGRSLASEEVLRDG